MTPKTSKYLAIVGGVLGGGLGVTILGFAMQFWISTNVKSQVDDIVHPIDVAEAQQLLIDLNSIKLGLIHIDENLDTALASQERFEKQFTDYLIGEAE